MQDQTPPSGDEIRAELSSADINDLPDSAFAYIEPGGTKDAEGKTVPRSLRHFPIQDKVHVQNALARAPQSPFGDRAMPAIKAAAKKFGIDVADDNRNKSAAAERRKKARRRAVPLLPEIRYRPIDIANVEVRSSSQSDEIVITGTPIVYDTPYIVVDMFGEFEERMAPGVADDVLGHPRGADVRFLFNHEGLPLARTKHQEASGAWISGTMTINDTPTEMNIRAVFDARQQLANDVAIAIQRGDVSQMSVGFCVADDDWNTAEDERTIHCFSDFLDVSAVTYPCSPTTSVEVAQRMALAAPVQSRARVRRAYAELREGKQPRELYETVLRSMLDIDPGEDTQTPGGTGPLGSPDGDGRTWSSPGSVAVDGTQSADGAQGIDDGTGTRSDATPKTSRGTVLRVQRALRGL